LAHGLSPPIDPSEASAEQNPDPRPLSPPQPRWITALATIPYSDIILSGSWDGNIRAWKVSDDKKKIESLGPIARGPEPPILTLMNGHGESNGSVSEVVTNNGGQARVQKDEESLRPVKGVVTDISVFERGERGENGICVVAALATEHRLGRWIRVKGKNAAVVLEVPAVARSRDIEVSGGGSTDE
jgi:ribosomal RNA-processing protein 9